MSNDFAMRWIGAKFIGTSPSGKTKRWRIETKFGDTLGYVEWFARWRKYCFAPEENTVYEQDCLRDLATFCEQRTADHRTKNIQESHV